jgi:hypothetical protein
LMCCGRGGTSDRSRSQAFARAALHIWDHIRGAGITLGCAPQPQWLP